MRRIFIFIFLLWGGLGAVKAQLNTDNILNIGKNALYFEDYVLAIQYFNQVIAVKPYLAEPFYFRGVAKYYLEDYGGAYEDCSTALGINPYLVNIYNLRGICLSELNEWERAVEDYKKGLHYSPYESNLLSNYIQAKTRLGDYDEALKYMDRLMVVDHTSRNFIVRGWVHLLMGDTVSALQDYDIALKKQRDSHEAYAARALVHLSQENYEKALQDFNEAVKHQSDNTTYLFQRALAHYYQDNLREAMADYDRVLILDEYHVPAFFNRSLLRSMVGDTEGALEDLNKVLQYEPDNYIARYNRVITRVDMKQLKEALMELNEILALYPDFISGYELRASIYAQQGKERQAQLDYNTAYVLSQKQEQEGAVVHANSANGGEDDEKKEEKQKTRKLSERNLSNYDKLVMIDKLEEGKRFESLIRGKVQNKNVPIKPQENYELSVLVPESNAVSYFIPELHRINKGQGDGNESVWLSKSHDALSELEVEMIFKRIDEYSLVITEDSSNYMSYFMRGLYWMMAQDYANALEDFNTCVLLEPTFTLAYFSRGNAYARMADFLKAESESLPNVEVDLGMSMARADNLKQNDKSLMFYELAIKDYRMVLEQSQDFYLALYNMANVRVRMKDFEVAIALYDQSLVIHDGMAESYFNKGLTEIFLGDIEQGNVSLSKAGELGLYQAYNVMKRHAGRRSISDKVLEGGLKNP